MENFIHANLIFLKRHMKEYKNFINILKELKQEDYELWIRTQYYSHLSEDQWDWLIKNVKDKYYEKNNK